MSRAMAHGQHERDWNGRNHHVWWLGVVETIFKGCDLNFGACFGVNFTQQTRHQSSFQKSFVSRFRGHVSVNRFFPTT